MREYGIDDGDMIVVDRALRARHGSIVVAVLDNDFTVKVLHNAGGASSSGPATPHTPTSSPKRTKSWKSGAWSSPASSALHEHVCSRSSMATTSTSAASERSGLCRASLLSS
jgi:hypothetical protein